MGGGRVYETTVLTELATRVFNAMVCLAFLNAPKASRELTAIGIVASPVSKGTAVAATVGANINCSKGPEVGAYVIIEPPIEKKLPPREPGLGLASKLRTVIVPLLSICKNHELTELRLKLSPFDTLKENPSSSPLIGIPLAQLVY